MTYGRILDKDALEYLKTKIGGGSVVIVVPFIIAIRSIAPTGASVFDAGPYMPIWWLLTPLI